MPTSKRNLTDADRRAAQRLKSLWQALPRDKRPTQQQLADAWEGPREATQSLISQYMNGGIALNYRAVLFFAGQLRCDPIEIRDDLPEQQAGVTVVRQWPTVRQDGRLPYLDADQILPFIRGEKPEIHDWMACPREDLGQRAFVTVVQGVAMSPQVEDGAFVFVDPDQTPKKGSLVLVLMPYPAVRVLQKEGDMQLLATTGTDWPGDKLTPLPEDAVIAGAVIGKWVPV